MFRVSRASPRAADECCACVRRRRNWVLGGARRECLQTRKWVLLLPGLRGSSSAGRARNRLLRALGDAGDHFSTTANPLEIAVFPIPPHWTHSSSSTRRTGLLLAVMNLMGNAPPHPRPRKGGRVVSRSSSLPLLTHRCPPSSETQVHSLCLD